MAASHYVKVDAAAARSVEFRRHASTTQQVFVAGTFNSWKPDATPPVRDRAGSGRVSSKLQRGFYEFEFVLDCQWCRAPGCEDDYRDGIKCVPNEFRTMSHVVEVV